MSKARSSVVVKAVQEAADAGRRRIVVNLGGEGVTSVEPIVTAWSDAIEQVEAMGWELTHLTVMQPEGNRLQASSQAYAAFRLL